MRGTFFGIEIAKTGLMLSQLGLDVTGHNIANVETRGYTRQRIIQTAYDPSFNIGKVLPVMQARVGAGTRVKILDQIRSAYLDRRFRTENQANKYWETRTRELRYLESFFDNVNEETSINYSIARLFNAMKILAEDAVEGAPRKLMQTAGLDLVQQLNTIYSGLMDLQSTQNEAVNINVSEINRIATELVELNKAIYGFELTGHVANDLRDKRNVLLDDLSGFIEVEYTEYTDKWGATAMKVSIAGHTLVDHDTRFVLGVREEYNAIPGEQKVSIPIWESYIDKTGFPVKTHPDYPELGDDLDMNSVRFGELKALMDMRDNDDVLLPGIPRYVQMLNDLARALVQQVNAVHEKGYNDPPIGPSTNGIKFFSDDAGWIYRNGAGDTLRKNAAGEWVDIDGVVVPDPVADGYDHLFDIAEITAKNIRLDDLIMESEFNIACSSVQIRKRDDPEGQQRGNNENMNDLFRLFNLTDISLTVSGRDVAVGSFDSFATSIRFDIGNTLFISGNMDDTSRTLTLSAENQRMSVSGVSLDEEMTNLIKYNHAYNGASRVITAMDDALDRLINGTGRVGL